MSGFRARAAAAAGVPEEAVEPLAGGDLSEVMLVRRRDQPALVAKGGPAVEVEAAMLRALAAAGIPSPAVADAKDGVLLLEHVPNDGALGEAAWADIGAALRRLHAVLGERYGWAEDYAFGTVSLRNRRSDDWPLFWGEQRLVATAAMLEPRLSRRVERLARELPSLLPARPPASLLHGDLWTGNILVRGGKLAALIDPACYHGHAEVDLAMLTLFGSPPEAFRTAYGALEPGWDERRPIYQLFPALVHQRLFGDAYAPMVDRLLRASGL